MWSASALKDRGQCPMTLSKGWWKQPEQDPRVFVIKVPCFSLEQMSLVSGGKCLVLPAMRPAG